MAESRFSVLVVDEDKEVRECLWDLFHSADYEVRLAGTSEETFAALPEGREEGWPHVIILGQSRPGMPDVFLTRLERERPQVRDRVSLIVFPSFRVSLAGQPPGEDRLVPVCRMSTVSNLLALVRGLARKLHAPLQAV